MRPTVDPWRYDRSMMVGRRNTVVSSKLTVAVAFAVGLLGGGIPFKYVSLVAVIAQSYAPMVMPSSSQPLRFTTTGGMTLSNFYADQGSIKLSPLVKLRIGKTAQTVTLELSR
jgi:hypothetical protein